MLASEDFRYAAPRVSSRWPAIVREPVGAQPAPTTIFAASGVSPHSIPAPSCPEPGQDGDEELFLLGERIADLAARINAAESRMMTLIADFDRRGGWKDGFSSCAEWLAWRIGIKIGAARERVRTARALEDLPRTADALREGSISYAKVRAITRVATPGSEADLLEFARAGSAAKLEQTVRIWRKLSREGELTAEEARHRSRTFSVFVDGDGMYVAKGRLEPEAGAVLMRAVEAASDALFRREEGADDARDTGDVRPEPKQRRADAVGLLAERALAAGFGGGECRDASGSLDSGNDSGGSSGAIASHDTGQPGSDSGEPNDGFGDLGDGLGDLGELDGGLHNSGCCSHDVPQAQRVESGTRAERYQVMVHCDAATLAAKGEPGRSDLDGIRVSAETSRRMACDAAVVAMVHAKDGALLNVGRRTRTIPPHIRRALEERDRGCRFPGCACRFTEAHHVKHWADGGETSLRNTLLLCRRHHRTVHEGRIKVGTDRDGTVLFFTPKGRILADAPGRARAPRSGEEGMAASRPIPVPCRWCDERHLVQRGRALPRFSHPMGDRSCCPGSRGGLSGRRPVEVWKPEIGRLASVSSIPG